MPRSSPSRKPVIGLDIEPGYVSAAEVHVNGGVTVVRAASATLAPGMVREGEIMDPDGVADVVKQLFKEHKLDRRVRVGVASPRIVVSTPVPAWNSSPATWSSGASRAAVIAAARSST